MHKAADSGSGVEQERGLPDMLLVGKKKCQTALLEEIRWSSFCVKLHGQAGQIQRAVKDGQRQAENAVVGKVAVAGHRTERKHVGKAQ